VARRLLIHLLVKNTRELVAAGCSGAVGTLLDFSVLVLLVGHGVQVAAAAFAGATLGAVVNFALNKYIAFRDRSPVTKQQLARFGFVAVATAALMALAMELVAVKLHVPVVAAKLVCAALVFAAWTYPAQRRLVFRRTPAVA
jgi:putative flippase GtrA